MDWCRRDTNTSCCRSVVWWWSSLAGEPAAATPTRSVFSASQNPRRRYWSCRPGHRRSIYRSRSPSPSRPSSRYDHPSSLLILLTSLFPLPFVPAAAFTQFQVFWQSSRLDKWSDELGSHWVRTEDLGREKFVIRFVNSL